LKELIWIYPEKWKILIEDKINISKLPIYSKIPYLKLPIRKITSKQIYKALKKSYKKNKKRLNFCKKK
jgi:hypothetical protein